jgi:hypothetical protein
MLLPKYCRSDKWAGDMRQSFNIAVEPRISVRYRRAFSHCLRCCKLTAGIMTYTRGKRLSFFCCAADTN